MCSDEIAHEHANTTCMDMERSVSFPNFDNYAEALLTLFRVGTLDKVKYILSYTLSEGCHAVSVVTESLTICLQPLHPNQWMPALTEAQNASGPIISFVLFLFFVGMEPLIVGNVCIGAMVICFKVR